MPSSLIHLYLLYHFSFHYCQHLNVGKKTIILFIFLNLFQLFLRFSIFHFFSKSYNLTYLMLHTRPRTVIFFPVALIFRFFDYFVKFFANHFLSPLFFLSSNNNINIISYFINVKFLFVFFIIFCYVYYIYYSWYVYIL